MVDRSPGFLMSLCAWRTCRPRATIRAGEGAGRFRDVSPGVGRSNLARGSVEHRQRCVGGRRPSISKEGGAADPGGRCRAFIARSRRVGRCPSARESPTRKKSKVRGGAIHLCVRQLAHSREERCRDCRIARICPSACPLSRCGRRAAQNNDAVATNAATLSRGHKGSSRAEQRINIRGARDPVFGRPDRFQPDKPARISARPAEPNGALMIRISTFVWRCRRNAPHRSVCRRRSCHPGDQDTCRPSRRLRRLR
jgi:hypothetical protein